MLWGRNGKDFAFAGPYFMSETYSQVTDPGNHPVATQKLFLTLFYGVWPAH